MSSLVLGIGIAALIIGTLALIAGGAALAIVIGLKNSTHQVVWKPLEPEKHEDPFTEEAEEEELTENPNKRIKRQNDEEDFADLDDPTVTSNF